ncbi:MAG: tetratricopeptide repeat protein [Bacteroidota bacterium]
MKKLSLSLFAMLLAVSTMFAQDAAGALRSANRAIDNFEVNGSTDTEKLQEAVTQLDVAMSDGAIASSYDFLMTKGKVYANILNAAVIKNSPLGATLGELPQVEAPGAQAAEAFMLAVSATDKKGKIKSAMRKLSDMQQNLSNGGLIALQNEDLATAMATLKAAGEVHNFLKEKGEESYYERIEDQEALARETYYGGLAALLMDDYEAAKPFYMKAQEMDYNDAGVYDGLFRIAQKEGNEEVAIAYLQEGREKFPDDNSLLFSEINYFLAKGELQVLLDRLKTAIDREPENEGLYTTLGSVYDKLYQDAFKEGDMELADQYFGEAKSYYEQTLDMNPKNATANYSLGALYYNKGANLSQELDALSEDLSREGTERYNEVTEIVNKEFEKALPYFVEAEKNDPNDTNILIALREMYARNGEYELSGEFKERYEKVVAGEEVESYFAQ